MFRKLAGSAELFYLPGITYLLPDLTRFLSQDILKLEFSQMPMCELILRIGLEIFNHLSDENNELDLKQTIYFIKEDLHEDIDFVRPNTKLARNHRPVRLRPGHLQRPDHLQTGPPSLFPENRPAAPKSL